MSSIHNHIIPKVCCPPPPPPPKKTNIKCQTAAHTHPIMKAPHKGGAVHLPSVQCHR